MFPYTSGEWISVSMTRSFYHNGKLRFEFTTDFKTTRKTKLGEKNE